MEGPFISTRNQWKRTPLERIIDAIKGASEEIVKKEQILQTIIDEKERMIFNYKIDDLKKTIDILNEEKNYRQKRVQRLNTNRAILLNRVTKLRIHQDKMKNNKYLKQEIDDLTKKLYLLITIWVHSDITNKSFI